MELAVPHPATHDSGTRQGLNLPPAIVRLLEAVERSLTSENSRRAYRTSLLHFFVWCGSGKGDGTFSRLSVLQFKDDLIGAGKTLENGEWKRRYAPATVNQRLASVRALAQEAADAGLIDQSAAAAIRRVRGEKQSGSTIGNWLQKAQVDELLMAVDRKSLRGKRDYAILAVLFCDRPSETRAGRAAGLDDSTAGRSMGLHRAPRQGRQDAQHQPSGLGIVGNQRLVRGYEDRPRPCVSEHFTPWEVGSEGDV